MLSGRSNTVAVRCRISAGSSSAAVKIVPPDERGCKSHWEQAACLKWATATGPSSVVRAEGYTHIRNSAYKHSTHSCVAQRRAPEVHRAPCHLSAYIIPNVLCNYDQTQLGLVQPRSNLSFAAVPPRLLKELCDRLQGFWCTPFRAKAGRREVGQMQSLTVYFISLTQKGVPIGFCTNPFLTTQNGVRNDCMLDECGRMANSTVRQNSQSAEGTATFPSVWLGAVRKKAWVFFSPFGRCSKCPSPGRPPRPCYLMPFCRKAQR